MKEALKRAAQAAGFMAAPVEATEVVAAVVEAVSGPTDVPEMTAEEMAAASAGEGVEGKALSYHQLVHAMSEMSAKFDSQASELATAVAALETAAAELTELKAANAKAAAEAVAAKMTAREASIVAELGTERATAFMAATKDMPDAQFETIMAAMKASGKAEADQPAFKEVGVDAQADVNALQAEAASNGTMAILAAKYQQTAK